MIRQYAISQLQNFIDNEKVIEALKARLLIEDNPECRQDISEALNLVAAPAISSEITAGQALQADEIIGLWKTADTTKLAELIKHVKLLDSEDQVKICCAVLSNHKSPAQIVPVLSLSRKIMMRDEVNACLEKLITAESSLVVIRIVSLLTRLKPVTLVPHLPALLTNRNLQVRLVAIKALHLLSRPEAIRLLHELMFSEDSAKRRSAFSFLFLLPFNDTGDIVLRLIERSDMPKSLEQVIGFLIYNNPDQRFFRRLTISYLLHGKKIESLKNFWSLAARSLVVAGLATGSEQDLKNETLAAARAFILRHTDKSTEQQQKKTGVSVGHQNMELSQLFAVKEFSSEHSEKLLKICRSSFSVAEVLAAIRLLIQHKLAAGPFVLWLEELLGNDSPEIQNMAVDALLAINKARLLPHLPILTFHKNPDIAEKSLKIFSQEFAEKFVEKLRLWMRDNNPAICAVACKGLLEIDFMQARDLILTLIKSVSKLDLIRLYTPVLLLNPDRLTVYKLSDLAAKSSGEKRKLLTQVAAEIKEELGESENDENTSTLDSIISEAALKEQWEEILARIKQIRYDSESKTLGDLLRTRAFNVVLLGFIILAMVVFMTRFKLGTSAIEGNRQTPLTKSAYSYDSGRNDAGNLDRKAECPWDYQVPELATPPDSLNQIMTIEERTALQEELKKEIGSSAGAIHADDHPIRLEVELQR